MKVFKTSALTFSLSTHAQQLCALGLLNQGHAIWQKRRNQNIFLQKTYGNFHQFALAFFLENLIGCICNHNKDVNSRGIKTLLFRSRAHWNNFVSEVSQRAQLYVRETVLPHINKTEKPSFKPWEDFVFCLSGRVIIFYVVWQFPNWTKALSIKPKPVQALPPFYERLLAWHCHRRI